MTNGKNMNLVKILSLLGLSKKEAVLRLRNNQIRINGEIHNLNDLLKVEDKYIDPPHTAYCQICWKFLFKK